MFETVYVYCEPAFEAGGIESIYQLVDAINNQGGNAYLAFYKPVAGDPIPNNYRKYNVKWTYNIEYNPKNLLIVPEVWTDWVGLYNIKYAVWWLSVDNNGGKFNDFNKDVLHFYQSNYAFTHLLKHNCKYMLPLFDYIYETEFTPTKKHDIVCYNPIKGFEVTKQIIAKLPDVEFKPLQHMSHKQVLTTLSESKLYIDFGNHPGRDRIPREATIKNNIVITNNRGSAKYFNDVVLPSGFKIEENEIDKICTVIQDCIANYSAKLSVGDLYRGVIRAQKAEVYNQAKQYFL